MSDMTDIFIIGGGINGAAIAADAAGRGLTVTLCERGDFASATSSASTKLIHGGLRYLELYEFRLVIDALRERQLLLKKAPHLIAPMQFILPHQKKLRPIWLMRIGLFLYDHLALKKHLPSSTFINLKKSIYGEPLAEKFTQGFSYYDCLTDDARLTMMNIMAAKNHGACTLNYHEFISAKPHDSAWQIQYKNRITEHITTCQAKVLINASGPWINITQEKINPAKKIEHTLIKGSHLIFPKLYAGNFAFLLQHTDNRIIFTIPYQDNFTLIGTTDTLAEQPAENLSISNDEENYLCQAVNNYFALSISPKDAVMSYAGTRCLKKEDKSRPSTMSRDYELQLSHENQLPLLTIIGGKITTHRSLAEKAINLLKPYFPTLKNPWTAHCPLPGGDFTQTNFMEFLNHLQTEFAFLPPPVIQHYAKNYGTQAYIFLKEVTSLHDLGEHFGSELYEKEVDYLIKYEMAKSLEDIIWRRTKFSLHLNDTQKTHLSHYVARRLNNGF